MQTKDSTLDQIASIQRNLAGVPRVFLSGGEPLLRRDFVEIVNIFHDHIVAVQTNATRGYFMAPKLVGKVSFINVGLEGPAQHNQPCARRLRQGDARHHGVQGGRIATVDLGSSAPQSA
jgi:MoaA/NifB/PqqE/SkfB family radical SAM enzyme